MIGRKGVTLTALQIREHDDLPSAFMHAYKGQRGQHTKKTIVNNSTAAIRTANRNNHPVYCNSRGQTWTWSSRMKCRVMCN